MKIEIWSDIMCPFCYIGKRNLETALEQIPFKDNLEIEWKSFQLDPSAPDVPQEDIFEYFSRNKGINPEQFKQMQANVVNYAKQVGLEYNFEKIVITNSKKVHLVIQKAKEKNLGDKAEEVFFHAYFVDGANLADVSILESLAEKIGLTKEDISSALSDKKYEEAFHDDLNIARLFGISGVPFFVFDRKYAISGAQPVDAFVETIQKSFSEWREKNPNSLIIEKSGNACDIDGVCE